jgi:peptidoglycan hydrolase-like protein with peptidoglycan-binding domain
MGLITKGAIKAKRIMAEFVKYAIPTLLHSLWREKIAKTQSYAAFKTLNKIADGETTSEGKRSLTLGDEGEAVEIIQQVLIKLNVLSEAESVEAYDETKDTNNKLQISTKIIKYEQGKYNEIVDRAVQTFQVFYTLEGGKKEVHKSIERPYISISRDETLGAIDKNTILAMDEALMNGWIYQEGEEFFPLDKMPADNLD